ncbi:hypothetical protein SLEP1_g38510 [Rubroshorea leprosula]|nr:hypothetical protein SLEP1_g38510 [Rubroshorea leprosula]
MDDPELENLHANRIAALKKEAEKREALKRQGHGEYREVCEGDFLGEVTGSEKVVCHFYHKEFYRITDKHLKALAPKHMDTKFIKLDAEMPIYIVALFPPGEGDDKNSGKTFLKRESHLMRVVGFQDIGGKDDFTTKTLEVLLLKKGVISEKKDEEDDDYLENARRTVRSSANHESDID